jgi:putative hydrolase of the HAD superfamily
VTNSPNVRAIVFDLDDTLFPKRQFTHGGLKAAAEALETLCGVHAPRTFIDLFEAGQRKKIFDLGLERLGIEPSKELVSKLDRAYREHEPQITLYQDAARLLDWIPFDIPLAIVSDGWEAVQRRKLVALGISERFSVCLFNFDLGKQWHKPSTRPFEAVERELGLTQTELMYVGDNPAKDFGAPTELGWQNVWVARADGIHAGVRPNPAHRIDHRLESLDGLAEILASASQSEQEA